MVMARGGAPLGGFRDILLLRVVLFSMLFKSRPNIFERRVGVLARKKTLESFAKPILEIARVLQIRQDEVNGLNVFPVPDGDTGTNMAQTWAGVVAAVRELPLDAEINRVWDAIRDGATKSARGNSGVILSHIIKGAVEVLRDAKRFDVKTLEAALIAADELARSKISNPKEGTIITVTAAMAEAAKEARRKRRKISVAIDMVVTAATTAVNSTPEMLNELLGEKLDVIDAGGYGLTLMVMAAYDLLTGNTVLDSTQFRGLQIGVRPNDSHEIHLEWVEGAPIYDVQGLIIPDGIVSEADLAGFLGEIGDSELITMTDELVRIHVHTDIPEVVLEKLRSLGEIQEFGVENMRSQAIEKGMLGREKPIGVVAVAAGSGIRELLAELGVDKVVDGGQTANPSVGMIIRAIERVNAKSVIVLPGNRNIIMAAQEACDNIGGKDCRVVETRSIPETISAMIRYEPERTLEDNTNSMAEAVHGVASGAIAVAIRDSETADGKAIREGEYIGVIDSSVFTAGEDITEVCIELVRELLERSEDASIISLYAGEELADASEVIDAVIEVFPDLEVNIYRGEQPVYRLLIGVE